VKADKQNPKAKKKNFQTTLNKHSQNGFRHLQHTRVGDDAVAGDAAWASVWF